MSAWPHEGTESDLVIRLIRSCPDGERARTLGSIPATLDQIEAWLTELAELESDCSGLDL